jgi:hypothetical protein
MAAGALGSVHSRLRHQNGDTHVVGFDDVFSDAGSTPAASTNLRFAKVVFAGSRLGFDRQPAVAALGTTPAASTNLRA